MGTTGAGSPARVAKSSPFCAPGLRLPTPRLGDLYVTSKLLVAPFALLMLATTFPLGNLALPTQGSMVELSLPARCGSPLACPAKSAPQGCMCFLAVAHIVTFPFEQCPSRTRVGGCMPARGIYPLGRTEIDICMVVRRDRQFSDGGAGGWSWLYLLAASPTLKGRSSRGKEGCFCGERGCRTFFVSSVIRKRSQC